MPLPVPAVRLWAYDRVMLDLSTAWYAHILRSTPAGHHLLDVGCGPFSAQAANASLLVTRDLRLTGVDTDVGYLQAARSRAMEAGIGVSGAASRITTVSIGWIWLEFATSRDGICTTASAARFEAT